MSKVLPTADSARTWTPSLGSVYRPSPTTATQPQGAPTEKTAPAKGEAPKVKNNTLETELERLAEDSFIRHLKYGGDYIDEKPITGQPGNFHVASTGRKEKPAKPPTLPTKTDGISGLGLQGPATAKNGKEGKKAEKSPRPPNAPKPRRRKTKTGSATPAS